MLREEMDPITRKWPERGGKLLIPGGWTLFIPRIEGVEAEFLHRWTKQLTGPKRGAMKARALAQQHAQDMFTRAWKQDVSKSVVYYAKRYGELHPERVREVDTGLWVCEGYDPQQAQGLYTPGRRPGKLGWVGARTFLEEMGGQDGD